jgi:hypothetical protein
MGMGEYDPSGAGPPASVAALSDDSVAKPKFGNGLKKHVPVL